MGCERGFFFYSLFFDNGGFIFFLIMEVLIFSFGLNYFYLSWVYRFINIKDSF